MPTNQHSASTQTLVPSAGSTISVCRSMGVMKLNSYGEEMSMAWKGGIEVDRAMKTWKECWKVDGDPIVRMEKWGGNGEILEVCNGTISVCRSMGIMKLNYYGEEMLMAWKGGKEVDRAMETLKECWKVDGESVVWREAMGQYFYIDYRSIVRLDIL